MLSISQWLFMMMIGWLLLTVPQESLAKASWQVLVVDWGLARGESERGPAVRLWGLAHGSRRRCGGVYHHQGATWWWGLHTLLLLQQVPRRVRVWDQEWGRGTSWDTQRGGHQLKSLRGVLLKTQPPAVEECNWRGHLLKNANGQAICILLKRICGSMTRVAFNEELLLAFNTNISEDLKEHLYFNTSFALFLRKSMERIKLMHLE